MNKKYLVFSVLAVIVVILAIVGLLGKGNDKKTSLGTAHTACDILKINTAQSLMQHIVTKTEDKDSEKNTSKPSKDMRITSCAYKEKTTADSPENVVSSAAKILRLEVDSPKTQAGADTNKHFFSQKQTQNIEVVQGYGDKALWDKYKSELYVLKKDVKYTISYGTSDTKERDLPTTEEAADLLSSRF